jgi:hypothetical protein
MEENLKASLEWLKDCAENGYIFETGDSKLLLDYITNLQQDLDKANDIIEKDRQFYKCRMDEYAELKKENEKLKEENKRIFSKVNDDELLISNAMNYAEAQDYKSRCEKANDFIDNYDVFKEFSFPLMKRDIENQIKSSIDYEFNSTFRKKLKNILNGVDEK